MIGGLLVGAGLGGTTAFYIFAGVALAAALVTALVPRAQHAEVPVAAVAPEPA